MSINTPKIASKISRAQHRFGRLIMTVLLLLLMLSPMLAMAGTSTGSSGTGATNGVDIGVEIF